MAIRKITGARWLLFLVLGGLGLLSVGSSPTTPDDHELSPEANAVSEGNYNFALELFSKLEAPSENQIISPFSISSALAMAYSGARGNTESQMTQVLHFPTNQSILHSGMAAILSSFTNLSKSGKVELKVTNGLWPQSNYKFKTGFLDLCRNNYQAEVGSVDFTKSAEIARRQINDWIERSTNKKIGNLFDPGSVNANTRLVIANAIYFKGKWVSRFERRKTRDAAFWVTPERATPVPTTLASETPPVPPAPNR